MRSDPTHVFPSHHLEKKIRNACSLVRLKTSSKQLFTYFRINGWLLSFARLLFRHITLGKQKAEFKMALHAYIMSGTEEMRNTV